MHDRFVLCASAADDVVANASSKAERRCNVVSPLQSAKSVHD
jgi:hypothetical protein